MSRRPDWWHAGHDVDRRGGAGCAHRCRPELAATALRTVREGFPNGLYVHYA